MNVANVGCLKGLSKRRQRSSSVRQRKPLPSWLTVDRNGEQNCREGGRWEKKSVRITPIDRMPEVDTPSCRLRAGSLL